MTTDRSWLKRASVAVCRHFATLDTVTNHANLHENRCVGARRARETVARDGDVGEIVLQSRAKPRDGLELVVDWSWIGLNWIGREEAVFNQV